MVAETRFRLAATITNAANARLFFSPTNKIYKNEDFVYI